MERMLTAILVRLLAFVLACLVIGPSLFIGPGGVVAAWEYPFGAGPWSATGRYCHKVVALGIIFNEVQASQHYTKGQRSQARAYATTLSTTGPIRVRRDFVAYFSALSAGQTGAFKTSSAKLNVWWNQSCSVPSNTVPASLNKYFAGFFGDNGPPFEYPRNIFYVKPGFRLP
jgi:hypothetical protein